MSVENGGAHLTCEVSRDSKEVVGGTRRNRGVKKWLIAVLCAFNGFVFLLFLAPLRDVPVLYDLPQFYFAAQLMRSGHVGDLYDTAAYTPLIERLREVDPHGNHSLYFNRPAFEGLLSLPLAFMSFNTASLLIIATNAVLLTLLVYLLPRWFPTKTLDRPWLFTFMPFLFTMALGQDTLLLTLIVAYGFRLALDKKDAVAGALLAVAGFKPHLILLLPLAMIASRRWKMVGSFAGVGISLAMISLGMVGPNGIRQWVHLLGAPTTDSKPEIMGNVRALGLQFDSAVAAFAGVIVVAAFILVLLRGSFVQRFAAALLAALLLSPHCFIQDYSVIAIVAMVALPSILRFAFFLPWPYFFPTVGGQNNVPFALLAIGSLVVIASGPVRIPILWPRRNQLRAPNLPEEVASK